MSAQQARCHFGIAIALTMLVGCSDVGEPPNQNPPTLAEIQSATYSGVGEESFTLSGGLWEGEPYSPGGASRPRAGIAPEFFLAGDLDGDGSVEAVISLWWSSGGSGTFDYLAVVARRGDQVANIGTAAIGDRIRILDGQIVDGRIELKILQQGPDDAACCPTAEVERSWLLTDAGLEELAAD